MANDNPNGFQPYRMSGGVTGTAPTEHAKTAAGEDISVGDPLVWSSGYLSKATATSGTIVGVAQESITGETGVNKDIAFTPVFEWVLFSAQCSGSPAVSVRGTTVDIETSSGSGDFEVNEDSTTTPTFRVLGLEDGYSWGEANARVYGVFAKSGWTGRT